MRILALAAVLAPLASPTCDSGPPAHASRDASTPPADVIVPGPYGLEERVCFALAERCDVACEAARFDELAALDGRLTVTQLSALDRCFAIPACGAFDACTSEWLSSVRG